MARKLANNGYMAKKKTLPNPNVAANFDFLQRNDPHARSQVDLENETQIPQTTIGRILKGGSTGADKLHKLCRAYGVTVEMINWPPDRFKKYLIDHGRTASLADAESHLQEIVEWTNTETLPSGLFALIPRIVIEIPAGKGQVVTHEEFGPPVALRTERLKQYGLRRENARVMQVRGDSMKPFINDGDDVVLDISKRDVIDGRVYGIRYGQELRVRCLYRRLDGGLILRSQNREQFPDEQISVEDTQHIEILGEMIWRGG